MDNFAFIKDVASTIGDGGLIIILVILWRAGLLKANAKGNLLEDKMGELIEHYNHTTTQLLTDIRDNSRDSLKILEEIERDGVKVKQK